MIPRIIPVLLIEHSRLVKSQKFRKNIYVGAPINAIKVFSQKYVDEIIICDKSKRETNAIDFDLLADMSLECFSPLTYAGGIRSESQVAKLFKIGVEKVCINSAIRRQPWLAESLISKYGAQSIVASVDLIKIFGRYRIYRHEKKFIKYNILPDDVLNHIRNIEEQGFGEIFINFVNRDGMYAGYDVKMIKAIAEIIKIPITVCGGCRNYDDLFNLAKETNVSGIAAGSVFSFRSESRGVLINYPDIREIEDNLGEFF